MSDHLQRRMRMQRDFGRAEFQRGLGESLGRVSGHSSVRARRIYEIRSRMRHPECRHCPALTHGGQDVDFCTVGFHPVGIERSRTWWKLRGTTRRPCQDYPRLVAAIRREKRREKRLEGTTDEH